jgi:hypothetical protein
MKAEGQTKGLVHNLGLYASSCCLEEALFDVNEQFSHCPKCQSSCSWFFVERVFSCQELEEMDALEEMDTLAA